LSEEPSEAHVTPPTAADRASESQISAALREDATTAQAEGVSGPTTQLPTEQSSDGSIENESTYAEGTGTFETIVLEGEAITQIEEYVPEETIDSEIASLAQRLEINTHEPTATPHEATDAERAETLLEGGNGEIDRDGAADGDAGEEILTADEFVPASGEQRRRWGPRQRWPWVTGCVLLGLLLLLQVVHHWRDALAADSPLHEPLTRTYAALGMPLDPHWDLAAYDVRQQGASADPTDSQLIHVRLSLANHASRAQPLPLLRLTLLDRYGKRVGTSDLTPQQYWPGGAPPRAFLGHDERVDSEVAVRDPSAASASFELDVCLRNAAGVLHCASDAAPPR
jgi:hypothetical protein